MKRIIILLIAITFAFSPFTISTAQKQNRTGVKCSNPTQDDLDCGVNLVVGKRGFYVPTDEEGCDVNAPQGCKFPATITAIESVPTGNGRFLPLRNALGQIVVSVHVERPAFKGGSFDKDRVAFTDGCKGCFRNVQSPDLAGF